MDKEQIKPKIDNLINQLNLDKLIDRAINSGAIDLNAYGNNFHLPKIILSAVLSEAATIIKPFGNDEEIINLRKFL